jgi:hypothetical protein
MKCKIGGINYTKIVVHVLHMPSVGLIYQLRASQYGTEIMVLVCKNRNGYAVLVFPEFLSEPHWKAMRYFSA